MERYFISAFGMFSCFIRSKIPFVSAKQDLISSGLPVSGPIVISPITRIFFSVAISSAFIDFRRDFRGVDRLYNVEDFDGSFDLVLLEVPDEMPFGFLTDFPVSPLRFLDVVFPDCSDTGLDSFEYLAGLSRLGGGYQQHASRKFV